jgi:hypothetical protein
VIEVPEFTSEMTERPEYLEGNKFPVESLVVSFYLATAARVIRPAKDEFNAMLLCFSFECF